MATQSSLDGGSTLSGPTEAGALSKLSPIEKLLLVVPLLGGLFFGLLPILAQRWFAQISQVSGDDPYVYRLAGAATFGYAIALFMAIRQGEWLPARNVVIATLTFNLGSLFAIAVAIATGTATLIVYAILVASILITAITSWLLYRHRGMARAEGDVARWLVRLVVLLAVVATGLGALVLLLPQLFAQLFGFLGTDGFIYRQAGAATLGYGIMGVFQLRTHAWRLWRLPSVMALVFNGLSFVVTVLALAGGERSILLPVVALVSLLATVGTFMALKRQGK